MRDKLEKFGIGCLLDTNFGPFNQPIPGRDHIKKAVDQLVEEGIQAEESGFEGVFVPESHMRTETAFPNPLVLLAALAGRTRRVRLSTYALIPTYGWNPMHLAESSALVDLLSKGRLTLVVAQGLVEESFRMFGVDPKTKLSTFVESIEILKKAWTSRQPFSYSGKRFQFDNVFLTPKPYQQDPHPTIWGGGLTDAAIKRVGTYATGWCSTPFPIQKDVWDRQVELFREEARAHGVENPKVVLMRDGFVAESREEAERICSDAYMPEWLYYFDAGVLSQQDPSIQSRSDVSIAKMRRHLVVGSPADCVEAIEKFRSEYRVDYIVMRFRSAWGPSREETLRCMKLFGSSVLSRFVDSKV
jgi:alkanesulfonate monooxygenase SsuD/methylene tetrahydromethanopterin reductase-like flavin-dependent oxidoreductase (luciferase family)